MNEIHSRRTFFRATGAVSAGLFAAPGIWAGVSRPNAERLQLTRQNIEAEIRRRADRYVNQRYLIVDYYRIRRRLAYPLPVRSLSIPSLPVPSISDYPWSIWMTWELEERINSLGWAAEWLNDTRSRSAAASDLQALAEWPRFRQYDRPDLSAGHAGRMLWTALTKWSWVSGDLRDRLRTGCARHVDEVLPESDRIHSGFRTSADILAQAEPHRQLHNIPLIGTIGASLAAKAADHPARPVLNQRIRAIFEAILELRTKGYTEGVCYDGYILDFVSDWLHTLGPDEQRPLLEHANMRGFLDGSYLLGAPGAAEQVAPIGDVEPKEMPFHLSAQAKIFDLQPDGVRAWHLNRWKIDWMMADALGALYPLSSNLEETVPAAGASNALYAVTLRSGWDEKDLAVVTSCSQSPAGHLQDDSGTLLIGSRGHWIITDPGYQQYMEDEEREFTLGPASHNYPVINRFPQERKKASLLALEKVGDGLLRTVLDLTGCYPDEARARAVTRTIWLWGRELVVVADQVSVESPEQLAYHWHGHPAAAWWCEDGWVLLHNPEVDLWFTSPQASLTAASIQRLPGSRGQLTLIAEADFRAQVVWWVFLLKDKPGMIRLEQDGRSLTVLDRTFAV